jgi:hypothetical protein
MYLFVFCWGGIALRWVCVTVTWPFLSSEAARITGNRSLLMYGTPLHFSGSLSREPSPPQNLQPIKVGYTAWQRHLQPPPICKASPPVDHFSISRIVAIRKLMLSTILLFRSETKKGSVFCAILHSHARSVTIGNTLPC